MWCPIGVHFIGPGETSLSVWLENLVTGVPFEIFLRESVECECGDCAFKKRGRHSPCTAGAAPATEIVAVDRNEALIHVRLPFFGIVSTTPLPMGHHVVAVTRSANLPRTARGGQVSKVLLQAVAR